jgi:hypothetical protein
VNILNASKIAMQNALEQLMPILIAELPIQMGITTPDGVYRMLRDYAKAHGQTPEKYLSEPSPDALLPPILAEEAITQIMNGEMPQGIPLEGNQAHLDKLKEFMQMDEFGYLDTPGKLEMFRKYMGGVAQRVKMEEMAKAAGPMGSGLGGTQGTPPGQPPNLGPPLVQDNELLDETLPSAGGGGNGGIR